MGAKDHHYAYRGNDARRGRRIPPRWFERLYRWWYRREYAQLTEFYRDFYPLWYAMSLQRQYVDHSLASAKSMDELASKHLRRVGDMERAITELRLALAAAGMGWNEDQVDKFMATWFNRHDLPQEPNTPTRKAP